MQDALKGFAEDMAERDCEYGDGCPDFAGSRHGTCTGCRARKALAAPVERRFTFADMVEACAEGFRRSAEFFDYAEVEGFVSDMLERHEAREPAPAESMFPCLSGGDFPRAVPWRLVEPLRANCARIHGQTLEQLADRGGLSAGELYGHVHGAKRFSDLSTDKDPRVMPWIKAWVPQVP